MHRHIALMTMLLLTGACADGPCPEDLYRACARAGCVPQVKAALAKDPTLARKADDRNRLPLNLAADRPIAEALLEAGADVDAADGSTLPPVWNAMKADRGEVVALLLSRGAQVSSPLVLLLKAAGAGRVRAVAAILESGIIEAGAADSDGVTALHLAALHDDLETARLLLERGADPAAVLKPGVRLGEMDEYAVDFKGLSRDVSGSTPLALAASEGMRELLRKHGAI